MNAHIVQVVDGPLVYGTVLTYVLHQMVKDDGNAGGCADVFTLGQEFTFRQKSCLFSLTI